MNRTQRAKQFAPFDALKGLQEALRLKEFQHERVQRGDIQQEKADEISKVLLGLQKGDVVWAKYFSNEHNFTVQGQAKIDVEKHVVEIDNVKIFIEDLLDIKNLSQQNKDGLDYE